MENVDLNKLFHKLNNKRRESSLNLERTITKKERKFKNLIINAFGRETIKEKPNSLKKLNQKKKKKQKKKQIYIKNPYKKTHKPKKKKNLIIIRFNSHHFHFLRQLLPIFTIILTSSFPKNPKPIQFRNIRFWFINFRI